MVSLPVLDRTGAQVGTYEFEIDELAERISKQLLHDAVVMYQSNMRQGTAKTKTRGEVAGSTKKMYRQKGTGNARAGHKRSGVRRGGGHIHAKSPRDWRLSMPRKAMKMATRMALRSKIESDQVVILDDIQIEAPKTKEMMGILKGLKIENKTVLLALPGYDLNVYKSGRNIPGLQVMPVSDMNALEILRPRVVVLTQAALDAYRGKVAASKKPQKSEYPQDPQE
ncbi:MAG: 50S ribosomal protein L4 [Planctomycetia bacterium]|nr:50S ribosomal protein L4 [Planctomycetia bacterium]